MSRKLTQEEVIGNFRAIHGGRYDYSRVRYVKSTDKVEIICLEHGVFWQQPAQHTFGQGCPRCRPQSQPASEQSVLNRFGDVHGDRYDYSLVKYTGDKNPVDIICSIHGVFSQRPDVHIRGSGCSGCFNDAQTLRQQSVIDAFREKHGAIYDYSLVQYTKSSEKVQIICAVHGAFWQVPSAHVMGQGCPTCGIEKNKLTEHEVLEKFIKAHTDRYDYSNVAYRSMGEKVEIICAKHGPFFQTPLSHADGRGCPSCAHETRSEALICSLDAVIANFQSVHGDRYDYRLVKYNGNKIDVEIVCYKHGSFWQSPDNHIHGSGCPRCANVGPSKGETEVGDYLKSICTEVILCNVRNVIKPLELDIYIPSMNIAIEFNGVYWHSDKRKSKNYHYDKHMACKEKGIRLISILDVDWENRRSQLERLLASALGLSTDAKLNARDCKVTEIPIVTCNAFLEQNHIQGKCAGKVRYGLSHPTEGLVAVMVFSMGGNLRGAPRTGQEPRWTLARFATSASVRGGAGKLFKHATAYLNMEQVISFSMNDLFSGGIYPTLGFAAEATVPPDYRVYHPRMGIRPKSHWQRRSIPKMLRDIGSDVVFNPETDSRTEWELEDEVGCHRIWDSGKIRWVWRKTT